MMSPYRVLAVNPTTKESHLLAAMLSTNNKTGYKAIYITEKPLPPDINKDSLITIRDLAHIQTTRKNSNIVSSYEVEYDNTCNKYMIRPTTVCGVQYAYVDELCYKLSDCLAAAMFDYCKSRYTIVSVY